MGRKVIQIAAATADEQLDSLYALCDDGSIWLYNHHSRDWSRLPGVPPESKNARPAAS